MNSLLQLLSGPESCDDSDAFSLICDAVLGEIHVFKEQELIELALLTSVARNDRAALARILLNRFGSFAGVISAPITQLTSVEGLSMAVVAALKLILISAQRLIKGELFNGPIISTSEELLRYLMATYAFEKNECLRILFLNARNYLLADEKHSRGTVNYTHAYPREIIKRAIELNGTALIMVHNHPSGDPSPSISDIDMTKEVYKAGKIFDIVLQDHIIIANTNWVSLRVLGLIS